MAGENGHTPQRLAERLEIRPDEHAALVDGRPLSLTLRELQLPEPRWRATRSGS